MGFKSSLYLVPNEIEILQLLGFKESRPKLKYIVDVDVGFVINPKTSDYSKGGAE